MSFTEITVEGTLKADGTIELDEKPNLTPGRVTLVVRQQQEPTPAPEGWWPLMQRIRAAREADGYHFMNEAEMEAHLSSLRDDEDRIERLRREMEQERRKAEGH